MKRVLIIFIILIILLLSLFTFARYITLSPIIYKNNNTLDKEANKEIKSLLINVIKDRHSALYSMNESKLYTDEYRSDYMQFDDSLTAKNILISIDSNFMDSVRKTNDNEFKAKIQMKFPDDWCYYFTIKVIDTQYLISYLEIDP